MRNEPALPYIVGMCIVNKVCIVKFVHPKYCALWECPLKKNVHLENVHPEYCKKSV